MRASGNEAAVAMPGRVIQQANIFLGERARRIAVAIHQPQVAAAAVGDEQNAVAVIGTVSAT